MAHCKQLSKEELYTISAELKRGGHLHTHLRAQKTYRTGIKDRRGAITGRISIHKRPIEIDKRERLGDFEGDTIIGAKHQGAFALLTLVERKNL